MTESDYRRKQTQLQIVLGAGTALGAVLTIVPGPAQAVLTSMIPLWGACLTGLGALVAGALWGLSPRRESPTIGPLPRAEGRITSLQDHAIVQRSQAVAGCVNVLPDDHSALVYVRPHSYDGWWLQGEGPLAIDHTGFWQINHVFLADNSVPAGTHVDIVLGVIHKTHVPNQMHHKGNPVFLPAELKVIDRKLVTVG